MSLLNNGTSSRGKDPVRFATGVDRTSSKPVEYKASAEYLAELEIRLKRKYPNETSRKNTTSPNPRRENSYLPEKKPTPQLPESVTEPARHRYIELRASGTNRTAALNSIVLEMGITIHTLYKLLKKWGYRESDKEKADIEAFCQNNASV